MSLGTYGSTLNDELNRLANGGTYPSISLYKDMAGAAQAWAAAESVELNGVTDLVGVLNLIYGNTNRRQWLDIAGICNLIAGTTGLEPAAALREVGGGGGLPTVTGGVLTSNATHYYRTFTTTDNLVVSDGTLACEALIIGGGGGGGYHAGGGAGGVQIATLSLASGVYTATIGAGGGPSGWTPLVGQDSSFGGVTSLGGGSINYAYSGSGTGAPHSEAAPYGVTWNIGYGTPGQGYNGGWGDNTYRAGGGGGGAASVGGSSPSNRIAGTGGSAILLSDWASATGTGVNGYYAGGGGGGACGSCTSADGGGGGATAGSAFGVGDATPNTGSGGGGSANVNGGAGGSGLVIVRYLKSAVPFVPYAPVMANITSVTNGGGIWPYKYTFSDGTEIVYGQPGLNISGKTVVGIAWGQYDALPISDYGLNQTTIYTDPDQGINYTCTSVLTATCPNGGTFNPTTNLCEQ